MAAQNPNTNTRRNTKVTDILKVITTSMKDTGKNAIAASIINTIMTRVTAMAVAAAGIITVVWDTAECHTRAAIVHGTGWGWAGRWA
jgi:hypothetical protein